MSLEAHYRVIREGAAIGAVASRGQIALTGRDRATYLQGLLTNDIAALQAGAGCYAAWLTAQGRMLTDMHVLQSDAMLLLDVPSALVEATVARLEQFIFSEDVQVSSLAGALTAVSVHGPAAAGVLEQVLTGAAGLAGWPEYRHAPLQFGSEPAVVTRIDQLGVPGYCVYLEPSREASFHDALVARGAVEAGTDAIAAARVEAGYPVFGVDMTEDTIPLEAGIEPRAISLTKGCYVGQELTARTHYRGTVRKRLIPVQVDGPTPAVGTPILYGSIEAGEMRSSSGNLALALLRLDILEDARRADGVLRAGTATVIPRPDRKSTRLNSSH